MSWPRIYTNGNRAIDENLPDHGEDAPAGKPLRPGVPAA